MPGRLASTARACAGAVILAATLASPAPADVVIDPVELPSPGGLAYDLAIGDFDEDGHDDVVHPGTSADLWLGDGAGTLTPVPLPDLTLAIHVEEGDFNGDGHLDIAAVGGYGAGSYLTVLLGDGAGAFEAKIVQGPAQASPFELTVADFDADGRDDVVVTEMGDWPGPTGPFAGGYSIWNGDVTAGLVQRIQVAVPGARVFDVDWGDLDDNGAIDLVFAASDGLRVALGVLDDGAPTGDFAEPVAYTQPASDARQADMVRVEDFDGDGAIDDVVSIKSEGPEIRVRTASATGALGAAGPPLALSTGHYGQDAAVADLDADGWLDIAVADITNEVKVAFGDGAGSFEDVAAVPFAEIGTSRGLETADLQEDGVDDLLLTDDYNTRWWWLRNAPYATFSRTEIDFGRVPRGTLAGPVAVTVVNEGAAPLLVDDVEVVGDDEAFRLGPEDCAGTVVDAQAACSIAAIFGPPDLGAYGGALLFTSNDADAPVLGVELYGEGTSPSVAQVAPSRPATTAPPVTGAPSARDAAGRVAAALRGLGLRRLLAQRRVRVSVTIPRGSLALDVRFRGTVVARGAARAAADGPVRVTLKLTRKGRRLLKAGRRALTVRAIVRPAGGSAGSATERVAVKARPARVVRVVR